MTGLLLLSLAHAAPPPPLPADACPTAADHATYEWAEVETYTAVMRNEPPEDMERFIVRMADELPSRIAAYETANGATWGTACLYARYSRLFHEVQPNPSWPDEVKEAFVATTEAHLMPLAASMQAKAVARARSAASSGEVWAPRAQALLAVMEADGSE